MQKNALCGRSVRAHAHHRYVTKTLLVMKLTIILLTAAIVQVSAKGLSQTVSFNGKNASLREVFSVVEKQTGFAFVYNAGLLNKSNPVSLNVTDIPLADFLQQVFHDQPLSYSIKNTTIAIFRKSVVSTGAISAADGDAILPPAPIRGRVLDADGKPLPGVTVALKGGKVLGFTNAEGIFNINVSIGDVLILSSVGFESTNYKISSSNVASSDPQSTSGTDVTLTINLKRKESQLNEVTINKGYYETTDRLKTGSVVKVTAKDIEKQPVTSPLMALQGRVPGVEVTPGSGAPGVAPKIRIRGTNSLRQQKVGNSTADIEEDGNYPLYIIDGVPVSAIPFNTMTSSFTAAGYDPLSTMNPANIESIEILKDGDATAMYGSRGANGVVIITTKRKTKSTDRTNIDISGYRGNGHISNQIRLLNTKEYLLIRNESLANSNLTPQQAGAFDLYFWDTTRNTNWQDVLLGGNSTISDVQANISSGGKNTTFSFNTGYHKETLIFPGDFGFKRLSGQLNVNHVSTNQKFRYSISNTYGLATSNFFSGDLMNEALRLLPYAPKLYNDDGSLNWELHDFPGDPGISTWINPLSYLKLTQDAKTRNNAANAIISYEILPGLSLSASGGYMYSSTEEIRRTPLSSQYDQRNTYVISMNVNDIKRSSWIVEPKLSYTKKINKHTFDFLAGGSWQQSTNAWLITNGSGYTSDALLGSLKGAGQVSISMDNATQYRFNSGYARFGYNWSDKYLLNLVGRRDGSSRFGAGNRYGNFGSIGAAWIFSAEKFVEHALPFMNFGKLRVSYGTTGSDNIGDYNYYSLYRIADNKLGGLSGVVPNALYNSNYAWELTRKWEAALELSFAQNRINLEINWYRNRSSNQLIPYSLSKVTGFESVQANFDATVQNTGWEMILSGDVLRTASLKWNIAINASLPSNKLVKFDGIETSPYYRNYKVGEPLSISYVYIWKGVNPQTGLHEFVDQDGDGTVNYRDRTLKDLAGTIYYGGINNNIQYKNIDISFLFQFSHRTGSRYLPYPPTFGRINQSVDLLNRWQKSGDITHVQKVDLGDSFTPYSMAQQSDYAVTDASFLRLKTLSIGYRLPGQWLQKAKVQDARLFLQGQNLLTMTKYEGVDPETGNGLPPLRMVTLGVQFKF